LYEGEVKGGREKHRSINVGDRKRLSGGGREGSREGKEGEQNTEEFTEKDEPEKKK